MQATKNPVGAGSKQSGMWGRCLNIKGIVADLSDNHKWYLARIRCKQWSCEYCATVNKRKWRKHICEEIQTMDTHEKWWFVTITAHKKAHKARFKLATLRNMQRGLKRLYDRLRRQVVKGTEKMEYVRVYECHKTGKFHAHIIIRATFKSASITTDAKGNDKGFTRWLKDNCSALGMGNQASAKMIRVENYGHHVLVAAYVTKYLTKQAQDFGIMPKGLRRVQCSSGFGALDDEPKDHDFEIVTGIYKQDLIMRDIVDLNLHKTITVSDFGNSYIYPPELIRA